MEIVHQRFTLKSRMHIPRYTGLINTSLVFFMCIATRFSSNMLQCLKLGFAAGFFAFFSLLTSLMSTRFLIFSIVWPNTELFMSLKKSFSNSLFAFDLKLVFRSMYFFNHGLSSNLIPLCIFIIFSPRLSLEIFVMYYVLCLVV